MVQRGRAGRHPDSFSYGSSCPGREGQSSAGASQDDAGREDGGAIGGECGCPKATNVGSVEGWVHLQG